MKGSRKPKPYSGDTIKGSQVQATNILEMVELPSTDVVDFRANVPVLAVLHNSIRFSDMWGDALENNMARVKNVAKKRAALYYSSLSPTTLSDIISKIGTVVKRSMEAFAYICGAWKYQNCLQFEDEDGYELSNVLNNTARRISSVRVLPVDASDKAMNFSINNADWKKYVLKPLEDIYLSETASEFIWTVCGHFIQIVDNDTHEKLVTWDEVDVFSGTNRAFTSFDKLKQAINAAVTEIDAAYNAYPFMDAILADLKLTAPGEKYNFTRDLAQTKLKVLSDTNDIISNMVFMTSVTPNTFDVITEHGTAAYSIVRGNDASHFEFYKDDEASAKQLNYADRCFVEIKSLTNALRGNANPENIAFITVDKGDNTKDERNMNPFVLKAWDPTLSTDPQFWAWLNESNQLNAELDMPNDAIALKLNSITQVGPTATDFTISTYQLQLFISSGDYLISAGDIESVISDATFEFMFGELKETPADAQTLGNNGTNK